MFTDRIEAAQAEPDKHPLGGIVGGALYANGAGVDSSGWDLLLKWFEEEAATEQDEPIDNPLESEKQ